MAGPSRGCPRWEIEFSPDGGLVADDGLTEATGPGGPGELFVFAPGWHSTPESASDLGDALCGLIAERLDPARRPGTGLVTVRWPSALFPEDEPAAGGPVVGVGPAAGRVPPPTPSTGHELALALAPAFPDQKDELTRIGGLLDSRPPDRCQLAELHRLISCLVTTPNDAPEDDGECTGRITRTRTAMAAMATLAPGGCGGEPDPFDTWWRGGRELLRVLAYYEMKNRAGLIGRAGLGPLLSRLARRRPGLRVHLLGHSFGARLAAFALDGLAPAPVTPVKSLVLVQAAFSHFAFAPALPHAPAGAGALAGRVDRVDGPLLATYSAADRAVGWWYPNASMLARREGQDSAEFGFRWGALGHDGFQQDGVVDVALRPVGHAYDWRPGTFYRLDAGHLVNRDLSWLAGAHSDIRKPELAWAAVSAASAVAAR